MTVTTCKTSLFSTDDISILVKTNKQGIKKQPCLWLVHGSGGISSNEDLWIERAFAEGFCVIIVDSYSNRGIYRSNSYNDTINYLENLGNNSNSLVDNNINKLKKCNDLISKIEKIFIGIFLSSFILYCAIIFSSAPNY